MSVQEQFACPYCDTMLNDGVLSCRGCGRDLTPVLPLLRRLDLLERRLGTLETSVESERLAPAAAPPALPAPAAEAQASALPAGGRRIRALPLGFAVLLAAYGTVVLWLDLPLSVLRLSSIVIPFVAGFAFFGVRPRLSWADVVIAMLFAVAAVATMNAWLGWVDSTPFAPQDAAGWRESFFYALSIGASMLSGMLLRVTMVALSARGLNSVPSLRDGLLAVNKNVPMDTLKAIELTILMAGTAISAVAGLVAGFLGLTR